MNKEVMNFSMVLYFKDTYYLSLCISIVLYIFAIFYAIPKIRHQKDNIPKYYKHLFAFWNLLLSFYSIICTIIMSSYFFNFKSIKNMICMFDENITTLSNPFFERSVEYAVSSFVISKIMEFGDTVFLVLMHKKIVFLHWYHHVLTAYCTAILVFEQEPIGMIFMLINAIVHSIMYFYFFVSQYSNKLNFIRKSITILQTIQMFIGVFLTILTYYYTFIINTPCKNIYTFVSLCRLFIMYFSYLVLFTKLYYNLYTKQK